MPASCKKTFISNILLMSGSMLIIRIIGMLSNIYFTSVIGASSTGLFHIIFSVYGFAVTLSVAGTGFAVTRLISEVGASSGRVCNIIVRKSLTISITTSLTVACVLFFSRKLLSEYLFKTPDTEIAIVLLAIALPPIALSSVLRGYFTAARKIGTLTFSQLAEEVVSIVVTIYLLSFMKNSSFGYMAIIGGIAFSAITAAVVDFVLYRICISPNLHTGTNPIPLYKDIFSISVPVALGAYLRSGLISAENTLIPVCLEASGTKNPLGEYGIIKGMSMYLLLFPTVFIGALANMLVPELADKRAGKKTNGIRYVAHKAIEATLSFAVLCSGIFLRCHNLAGEILYHNSKVGLYLGLLSLLAIPMYLDTVVDSMLKGINQQMSSLKYNIIDSIIRIIFIWFVIPQKGVMAYIFLLYASEIFNLWLSLGRLIKVTKLKLNIYTILKPLISGICAYIISDLICVGEIISSFVFFGVYIAVMFAFKRPQ